jgi:hypothetical protein
MTQIVRFMAFGTGRIGRASTCSPPLVTCAARRRCDWCRYRHEVRDLNFATEPTVPRWVSARIENDTLLIDTSDDSDAEINTALVHAGFAVHCLWRAEVTLERMFLDLTARSGARTRSLAVAAPKR